MTQWEAVKAILGAVGTLILFAIVGAGLLTMDTVTAAAPATSSILEEV